MGAKLGRGVGPRDHAQPLQALTEDRIGRDRADAGGDPLAQLGRHGARSEETEPAFEGGFRKTRLRRGRHLGGGGRAHGIGNPQQVQPAGLRLRQRRHQGRHQRVDAANGQVLQRGGRGAVGDVVPLQATVGAR